MDHFNIKAPKGKLQEVKAFYMEVLGLEVGSRPQLSSPGEWLYAGSNAIVHLSETDGQAPRKDKDYLDHIAFRCVGVNEYVKRLKKYSIQYKSAYIPDLDLTQLFFEDPVYITIELNFKGERL